MPISLHFYFIVSYKTTTKLLTLTLPDCSCFRNTKRKKGSTRNILRSRLLSQFPLYSHPSEHKFLFSLSLSLSLLLFALPLQRASTETLFSPSSIHPPPIFVTLPPFTTLFPVPNVLTHLAASSSSPLQSTNFIRTRFSCLDPQLFFKSYFRPSYDKLPFLTW